ncbi:transglutaminase domain-containing protein [Mycoplasma sp. 'Moose RK']|uniref:transglutaminase domain-containing protein n=1 Tax=Mycoplasma sp. 'Moose RK' TaxID=2780095 RepID=UPI0018C32BB4|nr:transglutaminase domain-containing protein [Mycoplasma sp. 'Moose RK']MBG0730556.1 leucine-rich repeat protein [Mycoplasma sp. 'Moose RK']
MTKKHGFLLLVLSPILLFSASCGAVTSKVDLQKNEKSNKKSEIFAPKPSLDSEKLAKIPENFSMEYSKLKVKVENFVQNELKPLKFEVFKDQLNSFLDDVNYHEAANFNKIGADFYKDNFEKLAQLFENIKQNYQKVVDFQVPKMDLKIEKKKKNAAETPENYNNLAYNLNSNNEAKNFMSLIDPSQIKDFEFHSYSEEKRKKVADFTKNLIKNVEKEAEKTKIIFDWIYKNVKYAGDLRLTPSLEPSAVLERKLAVCGGFSNLYKAMLDSVGIKNVIVIGWSKYGAHQWNLVYDSVAKQYFYSDPTWGYFRKNDQDFAKDHQTFQIIDTYFTKDKKTYEYNLGVSLFSSTETEVKPVEKIFNNLKVVSVSQEMFKKTETLYIGENIKKIDYQNGTFNVKRIVVSEKNSIFAAKDGILYNKDFSKLILIPEKYPENSLVLPRTVREIEDEKSSLKAKKLQKILVEPGNFWFRSYGGILYNNDLSEIIFVPENFQEKIVTSGNVSLKPHVFSFNNNIKEIEIAEGVTEIPDFTFNSLANLSTIYLPKTLQNFSKNAFVSINPKKIKIFYSPGISQKVVDTLEKLRIFYQVVKK